MALDTVNCLINGGTWTTVQDYLGAPASEQTFVEGLINAASWRANTETGRLLLARNRTDYYDGIGGVRLFARQAPINAVSSLHCDTSYAFDDDTLIDSDSYQLYGDRGLIILTTTVFAAGPRVIRLQDNEGYETVPYDLEDAVMQLTLAIYKKRREKRVGIASVNVEGRTITYKDALPDDVAAVFKRYWRPSVL